MKRFITLLIIALAVICWTPAHAGRPLPASQDGGSSATQASLHIDDILTALGIASEATHLGEFTGSTIADNQTVKAAIQAVETAVELKQDSNANLTAISGLTCTANQLIGANSGGTALECKDSISVSQINLVTNTGFISGLLPQVIITNATGAHDGDANAATLTDSGESFTTSQFVGMTIYNVTDGSSCTVTANNATTVTCTLAGGTDNDWDVDDVWQVGPGPGQSGSWFYVTAASTLRWPSTAGYAACMESASTAALTIDMPASMVFTGVLNTAVESTSAAEYIVSSGSTAGDYMCIVNKSTTSAQGKGKRGTWSQES